MLKLLRITAFIEGISYLLLFGVTMPLKYAFDTPGPNYVVGMAHGVLFVGYVVLVAVVTMKYKWNLKTFFLAQVASLLPFATFVADAKIFRKADDPKFKRTKA